MATKRPYSRPFSKEENDYLIELVKKYKSVIENKTNNGTNIQSKNIAWDNLTKDFNSKGLSMVRETHTLRNKWKGMKADAKKGYANYKSYTHGTGGGPPTQPISAMYDSILEVADRRTIEGGKGCPDSDFVYINSSVKPTIENSIALSNAKSLGKQSNSFEIAKNVEVEPDCNTQTIEMDTMEEENLVEELQTEGDTAGHPSSVWNGSGYTPAMLKKPPSKRLKTMSNSVGKSKRNHDIHSTNLINKKNVLKLQEEHFIELNKQQEKEKELFEVKKKRENDIFLADIQERFDRRKRSAELHKLELEERAEMKMRAEEIYLANRSERMRREKHDEEMFALEKEKIKLEIKVLKKSLGFNNNENLHPAMCD